MLTVNLANAMVRANERVLSRETAVLKHQQGLDAEVAKLIKEVRDEEAATELMTQLGLSYKLAEADQVRRQQGEWAHLPQERVFTVEAIERVCRAYGLRFLPSFMYKGALDEGIAPALEELKRLNRGVLPAGTYPFWLGGRFDGRASLQHHTYWIAAPKASFALQPRPQDPLLFCALGDNRFYLVHKWGNDLSVWRRIRCWLAKWALWWTGSAVFTAFWAWVPLFSSRPVNAHMFLLEAITSMISICFGITIGHFIGCLFRCDEPSAWNSPFSDNR